MISSVARKAVIRPDTTILKTAQLVGQQKALAKKLEFETQKLQEDQRAKQNKLLIENFKQLGEVPGSKIDVFARRLDEGTDDVQSKLLDPSIPQVEIQTNILDLGQQSKRFQNATITLEEQQTSLAEDPGRSIEGIARAQVAYLTDEDGNLKPDVDLSRNAIGEAIDNNLDTYNFPVKTKKFMEDVAETITSKTNAQQINGGLFTEIEIKKEAAKFAVLDEEGNIAMNENGEPTIVISNDSLARFQADKGFSRLIEDLQLENPKMSKKDAMEQILRENGAITVRTEEEAKVLTTPRDTEKEKRRSRNRSASDRLSFFEDDISVGGDSVLGALSSTRGIVETAIITEEVEIAGKKKGDVVNTEVITDDKGTTFQLVFDPNKLVSIPTLAGETDISVFGKGAKAGKFRVVNIRVDNADPKPGLVKLNAFMNATVDAKNRITATDFARQYDVKHEEDAPFDLKEGEVDPKNPFGVNLKN